MSQKQFAKMLGVTPAVINRVPKKPDRSKVATLRRTAERPWGSSCERSSELLFLCDPR